jgi:hypothetical protein
MTVQLSILDLLTSPDTSECISSPALVGGIMPLVLPDGEAPSGPDHVRASRFPSQESELDSTTSATCGRLGAGSSASAALQASLESRLRALPLGSTGYLLTWRRKTLPSQRQICRLHASAQSTLGPGSGLLPTPSGTSNHGKNHVAGRLDEWGGSSNPFRGTSLGKVHCPAFELWAMGYPEMLALLMPPATPSSRKSRRHSSERP